MAGRQSSLDGGNNSMMKPRQRGGETELDITPMIDVTFLLLIFFMVSSTMQDASTLDLPPAKHGGSVETKNAIILSINRPTSPGKAPEVVLASGEMCTPDESDKIRSDIELKIQSSDATSIEIVIQADRKVLTGDVKKVMRAITDIEGVKFNIAVKDK